MSAHLGSTRPRIPDGTKRQAGTFHPERENKKLPKKPFVIPEAPADLTGRPLVEYKYFSKLLGSSRVTNEDDLAALKMLATYWARWCDLQLELDKFTNVCWVLETQTKFGVTRAMMPEWKASLDIDAKILGLLGRFGMTPADRGRVSVIDGDSDEKKSEDEFN